jgi:hypothetical protein
MIGGFGGKGLGSECGIVELIGLLDDEEKLISRDGDGYSYTFSTLLASLFWSALSVKHLREIVL